MWQPADGQSISDSSHDGCEAIRIPGVISSMAELRSLLEQRFSCRPEVRACGAEISREAKQHDVDSYRIKSTKKMREMGGKTAVPRNAKATRRCVFKRSVRGMILIAQLVHEHT